MTDQPTDPLAEYKAELREKYTTALHQLVGVAAADIAAPADQTELLTDMLEFMAFTVVLKVAEITGADPADRWSLKRIWGELNKAQEQSLAQMLTEYSNAVHFGGEPK